MASQRNGAVGRVISHAAIVGVAQGSGYLFFFVFLLRAGLSPALALLAQAAIAGGRFAIRPLLLPLARRWGVRPLLIAGTLLIALQYPALGLVRGAGWPLVLLVAAAAVGEVFYWMSYNAYYAAIGDAERRGRQTAFREALLALINIVAPLLGAWALTAVPSFWAFCGVGLVQASAALPLLGAPDVAVRAEAPGLMRTARPAFLLMIADGWMDTSFFFVWQIALFVALKESFAAYGGAMAIAGAAGAVGALLLGPKIDAGHGRRATVMVYLLGALIVAARAASLAYPPLAVVANAAGALLMPLLIPVLVTVTANLNKASPCSLRFAMATEAGWDVGSVLACLVIAGLFAEGAPLETGVLLGLPAVLLQGWLLFRLYPRVSRAAAAS